MTSSYFPAFLLQTMRKSIEIIDDKKQNILLNVSLQINTFGTLQTVGDCKQNVISLGIRHLSINIRMKRNSQIDYLM